MADRSRLVVVVSVGIGQIFAWGSSYYLLGVLGEPIARDTGWSSQWIIASLSLGLLVSGAVSPRVGRSIEHFGGRPVLAVSALLLAAGLVVVGAAPSLPVFVTGWLIVGLGMGAGLYDPAFSALGRIYGEHARGAITQVTLFGGFASTVCWPLAALLQEHWGWRGTSLSFAVIDLALVMPAYLLGLPRESRRSSPVDGTREQSAAPPRPNGLRVATLFLVAGFVLASMIMTIVATQIIPIMQARGISLAEAVGFGALIGPSQVGARVLEAAFGRKQHPIWSLLVS